MLLMHADLQFYPGELDEVQSRIGIVLETVCFLLSGFTIATPNRLCGSHPSLLTDILLYAQMSSSLHSVAQGCRNVL